MRKPLLSVRPVGEYKTKGGPILAGRGAGESERMRDSLAAVRKAPNGVVRKMDGEGKEALVSLGLTLRLAVHTKGGMWLSN